MNSIYNKVVIPSFSESTSWQTYACVLLVYFCVCTIRFDIIKIDYDNGK